MRSKIYNKTELMFLVDKVFTKNKDLPKSIIEKDYWVTIVLDYLFSNFKYKDNILFKGGTSLSKCYNLIDRFSEDVDLFLDWKLLDISNEEFFKERSKTNQLKFNEVIENKLKDFLQNNFLLELKKDFKEILKDYDGSKYDFIYDESEPHVIHFKYPLLFENNELLQTIKLEIGVLTNPFPIETKEIQSFLQESFQENWELETIKVNVLDKRRTFYEKLKILHKEANRTNENRPKRYSRHYYDVYKMLQTDLKESSLKDIDLLFNVIDFNLKFYYTGYAKYDEVKTGNIKLIPNDQGLNIFKEDFSKMKSMIFDKEIDFDTIINSIREFEPKIQNAIKEYNKIKK